jgi:hypothetical protein
VWRREMCSGVVWESLGRRKIKGERYRKMLAWDD